jgi:hypothetical protein
MTENFIKFLEFWREWTHLSTPDVVGFVAVTRAPLTGADRLIALSVHQLRTTPSPLRSPSPSPEKKGPAGCCRWNNDTCGRLWPQEKASRSKGTRSVTAVDPRLAAQCSAVEQRALPDADAAWREENSLPWHSACGGRSSGHLGAAKSLTATVYRSSALTGLSCGPNFRDLTAVQICKIRSGTHTPGVRTPDHDRKVPPRIRGHEIFFHVVSMVSYWTSDIMIAAIVAIVLLTCPVPFRDVNWYLEHTTISSEISWDTIHRV